jgi:hypothetical protein
MRKMYHIDGGRRLEEAASDSPTGSPARAVMGRD